MTDFKRIEDGIIAVLRSELPELRTVEPYAGQLDGGRLPLRFPAAFVLYGGSEYKWLTGADYRESIVLSIVVADKDLGGRQSAYRLAKSVLDAFTNNDLDIGIENLRPLKASSHPVKTEAVSAYRVDFATAFSNASGAGGEGPVALKCCYLNILETSAVTLSAGAEEPAYPLHRLYDRNIGRAFKTTAAVTTEIKIDQGATPKPADRLIIPAGHNLSGMTLDIKHSDDDILYTAAIPQWTATGCSLIDKSWASLTKRYWKFIVTAPSIAPELPELFLSSTYTWEMQPSRPPAPEKLFNVENVLTSGGQDRFLIRGEPKRLRRYFMPACGEAQKDNVTALIEAWKGACPFYLCDHEGDWIFGKLEKPVSVAEAAYETYSFEFEFLEVLP